MPTPPITSMPPGMDIARIEAAMRTLAETAVAEEVRVAAQNGGSHPDYTDNVTAQAICLPVSYACREGYQTLARHLMTLIGRHATTEICNRISRDMNDEAAALIAQPAQARH